MNAEARQSSRPATRETIAEAAERLQGGELVAFPTETVYGLGADAGNPIAVAKLFDAKGRPHFNPLIVHLPEPGMAERHGRLNRDARLLAEAFWPGPLTLVVPFERLSPVCDLARAGLGTIGLRVPAHPVAHALLAAAGRPVAAPSANRSGHVSPTRAEHVADDLEGRVATILDAGPTRVGLESTIVACLGDGLQLLRSGAVTALQIEEAVGRPLDAPAGEAGDPISPGRLASHYAPRAAVRLEARELREGEALLAFGPDLPAGAQPVAVFNLSPAGDLVEAASRLYEGLRALDGSGARAIAAAPVPAEGLGAAINDRLARAAAPRG